jgi:hypothetical protein
MRRAVCAKSDAPAPRQIVAADYKLQAQEQRHKNLKRNLEEESRRNSRTPAQVLTRGMQRALR